MKEWVTAASISIAVMAGVVVVGGRLDNGHEARQYRKFCIESQTDQSRCNKGPAGEAKRRCALGEWPPGVGPGYAIQCEKAWLSQIK